MRTKPWFKTELLKSIHTDVEVEFDFLLKSTFCRLDFDASECGSVDGLYGK